MRRRATSAPSGRRLCASASQSVGRAAGRLLARLAEHVAVLARTGLKVPAGRFAKKKRPSLPVHLRVFAMGASGRGEAGVMTADSVTVTPAMPSRVPLRRPGQQQARARRVRRLGWPDVKNAAAGDGDDADLVSGGRRGQKEGGRDNCQELSNAMMHVPPHDTPPPRASGFEERIAHSRLQFIAVPRCAEMRLLLAFI